MLFKKNSSGKMMQWEISIEPSETGTNYQYIVTKFGQVGGKIQETKDLITHGKNLGQSNETTVLEQAESEARSKWQKQKDSGYVESMEQAEAGINEVEGFVPMLAQAFEKHGDKIKWPAAIQPKLDGIRCCAIITGTTVNLYSRKGKPITAVPHIEQELLAVFGGTETVWQVDGELYNHELKHDFEKLVSIVRKQKEIDEEKQMQYHIYDANMTGYFINRYAAMNTMISKNNPQYLKIVPTVKADNEEEAELKQIEFVNQGYEGAMARNIASPYEEKRSYNLQKMKKFMDQEYPIVGIEEGRGKLTGHAATFVCQTPEGVTFKAKMKGEQSRLKDFFDDHSLWEGKILTVKFFEFTSKNNVPRFPVGIAIRDYE